MVKINNIKQHMYLFLSRSKKIRRYVKAYLLTFYIDLNLYNCIIAQKNELLGIVRWFWWE